MSVIGLDSVHGGADALGVPMHDFSTNANACGPCPVALAMVRDADPTHYPDPAATHLRTALAALHQVDPRRVLLLASASEGIQRLTAWAAQSAGASVWLPPHHYGDCARAALAWRLPRAARAEDARLIWACEPSTPLGQADEGLAQRVHGLRDGQTLVLDRAYAPLRLQGESSLAASVLDRIWQLWSPNKALGMTGVRGAYAIAPTQSGDALGALHALAPSWPLGAHAEAMLRAWSLPEVQAWVHGCADSLRGWKQRQQAVCESLGWQVLPSEANYFVARLPGEQPTRRLDALRRHHGVKLRDCASFGLPGHVRLGVRAPASQDALLAAWNHSHEGDNAPAPETRSP
ncbi:MAG: aminotransferase class I/II-fold pyridoxal phosphate-dependent enzyme [Hydrogenophaga sp.]|uniref:aminotransferase class I/II-fold pyridoxal phosphate-dependent enzyme n=1 Tax=Hydrogenophaga sp. TaxID=1904254 RepID=UPI001DEF19E3|nr:aminotransferase class I/II-fold pyridoxal phosphate-dependent enzyme [Hydrogenophaga sp.]MBX3609791.1 aminotransferase class I/II-fold pyridoxal phosphate-dependent enzyme [Hydrogenophaga sp.]